MSVRETVNVRDVVMVRVSVRVRVSVLFGEGYAVATVAGEATVV
ncbi:MAG: hypothetical protein NT020_09065 [Chloroflexales bacterium]|nr:hypothetical protein [Chloroflexales bacterium]